MNQHHDSVVAPLALCLPFGDNQTALGTGPDATEHHFTGVPGDRSSSMGWFTGQEHDAESGLDHFAARYYQSQTGRWLLPDWSATPVPVPYATFTNPQSLNLYTYVGNNPVNAMDADGHEPPQNGNTSTGNNPTAINGNPNCGQVGVTAAAGSPCPLVDNGGVRSPTADANKVSQDQTADAKTQQQGAPKTGFWHGLGQRFNNLFHGDGFVTNMGLKSSTTIEHGPGTATEPNPVVAVGTDALGLAGAATGHPGLGRVGAAISVGNDPGVSNLVMTGMSFVPVVGEAVGAVTAVQDVGLLAGQWITDNIMAPMFNAAPPQMINANGISTPNPALMNEGDLIP